MSVMSLGLALSKCGYTNNHCSTKWYCNERFLLPMMNFDRTVRKSLSVRRQRAARSGPLCCLVEKFLKLAPFFDWRARDCVILTVMFNLEMSVLVGRLNIHVHIKTLQLFFDATASNRWLKTSKVISGDDRLIWIALSGERLFILLFFI